MNLQSQEQLAKLLSKENLSVQHGNYQTASFDIKNRVLRLPLWEDKGKDVYDLLVGHEVGHALYTPYEGWHEAATSVSNIPKGFLNIVEDIRIERKIQETYPGLKRRFKKGYVRLVEDNLFGTEGKDLSELSFMDRLNISAKTRGEIPIEFSSEEVPYVNKAMAVETWDDVVNVCQELTDWLREQEEEEEKDEDGEMSSGTEESDEDQDGSSASQSEEGEPSNEEQEAEEQEASASSSDQMATDTDDAFRNNEEQLLEKDKHGKTQPEFSSGISDENLDKVICSYASAKKMRDQVIDQRSTGREDRLHYNVYVSEQVTEKFLEDKKGWNKTATLLAKDFERKKAAFEYSRATVSKRGTLNTDKMYQYKYSEDIFNSVTQLAQAQSHGIIMQIDLSGSMSDVISDVVAQAITIALFCKKVHIPFEVYTFTSSGARTTTLPQNKSIEVSGNGIQGIHNLKIVESLNTNMKKAEFNEAARALFSLGAVHSYSNARFGYIDRYSIAACDEMGTTPLIQAVIVTARLAEKFQRKHNVQKLNIMMLTDGFADQIHTEHDEHRDISIDYRGSMSIMFKGKRVTAENTREMMKGCLLRLKEITKAKTIGFFLAANKSDYGSGLYNLGGPHARLDFNSEYKAWRKNNFTAKKKAAGYDEYFIIKVGGKPVPEEFNLPSDKSEKIKDIRNQFKKFNKSKKSTKQLVSRISDAVAI